MPNDDKLLNEAWEASGSEQTIVDDAWDASEPNYFSPESQSRLAQGLPLQGGVGNYDNVIDEANAAFTSGFVPANDYVVNAGIGGVKGIWDIANLIHAPFQAISDAIPKPFDEYNPRKAYQEKYGHNPNDMLTDFLQGYEKATPYPHGFQTARVVAPAMIAPTYGGGSIPLMMAESGATSAALDAADQFQSGKPFNAEQFATNTGIGAAMGPIGRGLGGLVKMGAQKAGSGLQKIFGKFKAPPKEDIVYLPGPTGDVPVPAPQPAPQPVAPAQGGDLLDSVLGKMQHKPEAANVVGDVQPTNIIESLTGVKPKAPEGAVRKVRDKVGKQKITDNIKNQAELSGDDMKQLEEFVDLQAKYKQGQKSLEEFKGRIYDRLVKEGKIKDGETFTAPNGAVLSKKVEPKLSLKESDAITKIRDAAGAKHGQKVTPGKGEHVAVDVDPPNIEKMPMKESIEESFNDLVAKHRQLNSKSKKAPGMASQLGEMRKDVAEMLQKYKDDIGQVKKVVEIKDANGNPVKAHVELRYNPDKVSLSKRAKEIADRAKRMIKSKVAADPSRTPSVEHKLNVQRAKKVLHAVGLGYVLAGDQAAYAADGEEVKKGGFDFGVALRSALAIYYGKKAFGKLSNYVKDPEDFKLASIMFNDLVQHTEVIDKALGTRLVDDFWNTSGVIQQKTFNVKMPGPEKFHLVSEALSKRLIGGRIYKAIKDLPEAAQKEYSELVKKQRKEGKIVTTAKEFVEKKFYDAAQAGEGEFAGLNKDQIEAFITSDLGKRALAYNFGKQLENVNRVIEIFDANKEGLSQEAKAMLKEMGIKNIPNLEKYSTNGLKVARDGLKMLHTNLQGSNQLNAADKLILKHLANFMDFNFFMNPHFEVMNYGDIAMMGIGKVGPRNLWNSLKALSPKFGDKELREMYKNSNLAGGMAQLRKEARMLSETPGKERKFDLPDFMKSDGVNAARLSMGSFLQYAEAKGGAKSEKEAVQWVKRLLKGELDPETTVDAWAHQSEVMSRTLGFDPLHANGNVLAKGGIARAFSILANQPARYINLLTDFVSKGKMDAAFWMVGTTAVLAGEGAIPKDVGYAWKKIDHESYFMVANLLRMVDLPKYVTGAIPFVPEMSMSDKYQPSLFFPVSAASNPLGGVVTDTTKHMFEGAVAASAGDFNDPRHLIGMGKGLAMMFKPDVGGISSRLILELIISAKEAMYDLMTVWYFDEVGKQFANKDVVSLSQMGINRLFHPARKVLIPGTPDKVKQMQNFKEESHIKKKGSVVPNLFKHFGIQSNTTISQPPTFQDKKPDKGMRNILGGR